MAITNRSSGILMHITSLPSKYGIGTLGEEAYKFADFLKAAGQKYWQVLPLGPTSIGNSPYSSFSTFAGNDLLIDVEMLIEDGLVPQELADSLDWGDDAERVDFDKVRAAKNTVLEEAFRNGFERDGEDVQKFADSNFWVTDFAVFMALHESSGGRPWTEWDEDIRRRDAAALERVSCELKDRINYHTYIQYLFFKQWAMLKAYAGGLGIKIIGDMPIYVAMDSADIWREPQFFQLDDQFVPSSVAGVPPDYFSEDGQLWGNPLYDWHRMQSDGYGWWIRRVEGAIRMFDVIRIDHFRAFASYWAVPYGSETAKNGQWIKGPGMSIIGMLKNWFYGTEFIAEDLGILTPDVGELLEASGLPGMNILEFAFSEDASSKYLPHKCAENSICYTGTHDNDTVVGWWHDDTVPEASKAVAEIYMGLADDASDTEVSRAFIRAGMASPSCLFAAQMQDWLALPASARMNVPGVALGNWSWRARPGFADESLAAEIREYSRVFSRLA